MYLLNDVCPRAMKLIEGFTSNSFSKFMTASLAQAFDLRGYLQNGQALMSGRLHSRWKECPQPRKMRHKGLSRLHSITDF